MIRASCLCGAIEYAMEVEPHRAQYCHCSRCRKRSGSAFTTTAFVPADKLRFIRGEDEIQLYRPPNGGGFAARFCRTCGSPVAGRFRFRGREVAAVPMGTLDDEPGHVPERHTFIGSKASWHTISDDLERYEELPPDFLEPDGG